MSLYIMQYTKWVNCIPLNIFICDNIEKYSSAYTDLLFTSLPLFFCPFTENLDISLVSVDIKYVFMFFHISKEILL